MWRELLGARGGDRGSKNRNALPSLLRVAAEGWITSRGEHKLRTGQPAKGILAYSEFGGSSHLERVTQGLPGSHASINGRDFGSVHRDISPPNPRVITSSPS